MRSYASISPLFWTRGSGKRLRGHAEAQVVALYLMSSPGTSMVGIFPLSLATLCHETGLPLEGARKGLQRCAEEHLAFWDEEEELVWVPALAKHQIGETLKEKDKRVKGVLRALAPFRGHRFHDLFLERYGLLFSLESSPSQAPPKPLPRDYVPDPGLVPDPVSDPDQPDRSPTGSSPDASSGVVPRAEPAPPYDLTSALELPPQARALAAQRDPHGVGAFSRPAEWPEIRAFAAALVVLGWLVKLGSYPKDAGLAAAVELLAAGYTQADLLRAAELAARSKWFQADKSRRVLSSFTPKVVARLLAAGDQNTAPVSTSDAPRAVINGHLDMTSEADDALRRAFGEEAAV